ncbi:hypothetical protein HDU81_007425, partial [Chytriomyces hyalinus]
NKDVSVFDGKVAAGFKNRAYLLKSNFMDKACKLGMSSRVATAPDVCYNSVNYDTLAPLSIKYTLGPGAPVVRTTYYGAGCSGIVAESYFHVADGSCFDGTVFKLYNVNGGQTASPTKSGASSLEFMGFAAFAAMVALIV